jgi:hypothetical protein
VAALLLRQAEQAPAAVESALSQLPQTRRQIEIGLTSAFNTAALAGSVDPGYTSAPPACRSPIGGGCLEAPKQDQRCFGFVGAARSSEVVQPVRSLEPSAVSRA